MTSHWRALLRADPTPWLLERQNPAVRYGTLIDLLDRPADDPVEAPGARRSTSANWANPTSG